LLADTTTDFDKMLGSKQNSLKIRRKSW